MEHTYQQISAADLQLLKSLLEVFGEAFGEPQTYQGAVPSDAYVMWSGSLSQTTTSRAVPPLAFTTSW